MLPCNNTLQWSAERDVFVSLSLRRLGLLLKTVPVGGVFLRQGRGHGDEVTEGQQRERGGRRARRSMTLMRGGEEEKDLNALKMSAHSSCVQWFLLRMQDLVLVRALQPPGGQRPISSPA